MNKLFYNADDISKQLEVSKAYAYKIIRKLNDELSAKGYITVSGKISKEYYNDRIYHSNKGSEM